MTLDATRHSDIAVSPISSALAGRHLDVIVSGSIGAVESVRLIRSLRRLGARVTPWLTKGGAQFVTPMALSWAAGEPAQVAFEGHASHVAIHDGCIVAPASASFLGRLALGQTDTPASAIATAYLGAKLPVMVLPSMHDSLALAPAVIKNLDALRSWGVAVLSPRREEGKHKMPSAETLADEVAHHWHQSQSQSKTPARVMITMGGTRADIDDVRFLGNYSSGALGTAIAEEAYRWGLQTFVVAGSAERRPRVFTQLESAESHEAMSQACLSLCQQGMDAGVMAAAVLDFVPTEKLSGKLRSSDEPPLIRLRKTPKILDLLQPRPAVLVTFKLEPSVTAEQVIQIAKKYHQSTGATLVVINERQHVSATKHVASVVDPGSGFSIRIFEGKRALAMAIVEHMRNQIQQKDLPNP